MSPVAPRALAVSLATLLVSCSVTRSAEIGPSSPRELAKYALVVEHRPDGQVASTWIPLKEFDLAKYALTSNRPDTRREIVRVSSSGLSEYCEGRHDQCVEDCLSSPKPFVIGGRKYMDPQAQPWRIARGWWCPSNCMEEMIRCKKGRGEWADQYVRFDAMDPAIDWIKRHREELAVGAVVVIAGVAFAVVAAGTGGAALVLAPLLILAGSSSELPSGARLAEAWR